MTTDREGYDPRDAEFTGILAQRLRPSEDPATKLPALREALGVETDREGLLALAGIFVQGFKPEMPPQRRRKRAGRPTLLSLMDEARGSSVDGRDALPLPDFLIADLEERLFSRMEAILTAAKRSGRPMKVRDVALQVIEEEEFEDGRRNHFSVDDSVSKKKRGVFADSVASLFTHRGRRRKEHAAAWRDLRVNMEREVREWLKPRWCQILQETIDRVGQEAVDRVAAGERAEDVLADAPERALEMSKEIVERDWPI